MITFTNFQNEALSTANEIRKGIIDKAPRAGKCFVGLKHIDDCNYQKVLWIIPTADFDLLTEIKKLELEKLIPLIKTCHQKSFPKYYKESWDLIIWDEIQDITKANAELLGQVSCNIIALTGTYPNDKYKKYRLEHIAKLPIIYSFPIDKAIDEKVIRDYHITVHQIPLDIKENIPVSLPNGSKFITSERKTYDSLVRKMISYQETTGFKSSKLAIYTLKVVNGFKSKIEFVKKLIKQLDGRYLIFVEDTKIADNLGYPCYHSKTSLENLNKFNNEEIDKLVLVNKGSTGKTYTNVDGCILVSVNSSNDYILQRLFRAAIYIEGKISDHHIIISKDTIQEAYLETALVDLDNEKIDRIKYE